MQRYGRVIRLRAEGADEYEQLHRQPWPAVLAALSRAGIRNFSIYRYGDLLFSYFEYHGDDLLTDEATMALDEDVAAWLRKCDPLQEPVEEREPGTWWHGIPEIFHCE